jgi:hypothetical protein
VGCSVWLSVWMKYRYITSHAAQVPHQRQQLQPAQHHQRVRVSDILKSAAFWLTFHSREFRFIGLKPKHSVILPNITADPRVRPFPHPFLPLHIRHPSVFFLNAVFFHPLPHSSAPQVLCVLYLGTTSCAAPRVLQVRHGFSRACPRRISSHASF